MLLNGSIWAAKTTDRRARKQKKRNRWTRSLSPAEIKRQQSVARVQNRRNEIKSSWAEKNLHFFFLFSWKRDAAAINITTPAGRIGPSFFFNEIVHSSHLFPFLLHLFDFFPSYFIFSTAILALRFCSDRLHFSAGPSVLAISCEPRDHPRSSNIWTSGRATQWQQFLFDFKLKYPEMLLDR